MKKWYVYELVNLMGTIEDVGRTYRPERRFYDHTKRKPTEGISGVGKYYGRQDLLMNIVAEFDTKKEANLYEGELKLSYGMEWIERETGVKLGKKYGTPERGKEMGLLNGKPILVYKKDGTFVGEYKSASEFARILQIKPNYVLRVVDSKGIRKSVKGYIIKTK
jgi:hypothetical protein